MADQSELDTERDAKRAKLHQGGASSLFHGSIRGGGASSHKLTFAGNMPPSIKLGAAGPMYERSEATKRVPAGVDEDWHSIDTIPEGEHVALYFEQGEKGNGGIEMARVFKDDVTGEWSYWTHGGPNAGSDWQPVRGERPVAWRRVLPPNVRR